MKSERKDRQRDSERERHEREKRKTRKTERHWKDRERPETGVDVVAHNVTATTVKRENTHDEKESLFVVLRERERKTDSPKNNRQKKDEQERQNE